MSGGLTIESLLSQYKTKNEPPRTEPVNDDDTTMKLACDLQACTSAISDGEVIDGEVLKDTSLLKTAEEVVRRLTAVELQYLEEEATFRKEAAERGFPEDKVNAILDKRAEILVQRFEQEMDKLAGTEQVAAQGWKKVLKGIGTHALAGGASAGTGYIVGKKHGRKAEQADFISSLRSQMSSDSGMPEVSGDAT